MYGYENDFEFKNEHQIKNLQELLLQQSISVFIMNETRENQIKQIKHFLI